MEMSFICLNAIVQYKDVIKKWLKKHQRQVLQQKILKNIN